MIKKDDMRLKAAIDKYVKAHENLDKMLDEYGVYGALSEIHPVEDIETLEHISKILCADITNAKTHNGVVRNVNYGFLNFYTVEYVEERAK